MYNLFSVAILMRGQNTVKGEKKSRVIIKTLGLKRRALSLSDLDVGEGIHSITAYFVCSAVLN